MYVPHYYKAQNLQQVEDFIKSRPFGILVSIENGLPIATHIPLLLHKNEKGEQFLLGHVARGNRQWKTLTDQAGVLAIFSDEHAYISSSWYDHENVPTWNYMAVHVYGKADIIEGEQLRAALKDLVDTFESGSENPVHLDDLSEKFLKNQMRGIKGISIKIERVEAAFKLSQNRDEKNYRNVIEALEKRGAANDHKIAKAMKNRMGLNHPDLTGKDE